MTVKLAKFFSTSQPAPPLPPPNNSYFNSTRVHPTYDATMYAPQRAQHQAYSPYIAAMHADSDAHHHDDGGEEYDSLSMYSGKNGTSIMTARDHPFNNSQRPLLAERKPINKPFSSKLTGGGGKKNGAAKTSMATVQPPLPPLPPQRSEYISPYVQAQKRDSAKGLHGFNNFDMLSQQYNAQLLQSPHIGYPYGSPPSPTANSQDFIFDGTLEGRSRATSAAKWPVVGGGVPSAASSSHFEDDFAAGTVTATPSGPFVFGVPFEQQTSSVVTQQLLPGGGRGFQDDAQAVDHADRDVAVLQQHQQQQQQEQQQQQLILNSDASYNSHDSSSGSSTKAATKSLLRKRKSKKNGKGPEIVGGATANKKQSASQQQEQKQQQPHRKPTIKCVVVGDGAVGKTNLILSYLGSAFNPEHVPTASDIYNADVMVNDSPVHLTLCDTAGQDTLDPLRELCYPDSDVFILCFSIAKPETFHAIRSKWAPKFAKTKAALILVGTQADLRTNGNVLNKLQLNGEKPVAYADASDLAASIGAKYVETSSATQDKVKEVFDTAIWEGLRPTTLPPTPRPPLWKRLCCLA